MILSKANTNEDNDAIDELLEFEEDGDENKNTKKTLLVDEHGCLPGYKWDRLTGCIQTNCYNEAIPHAHWSHIGKCVCGSSGSIDEDPKDYNQECAYGADYESCPGCVYKCDKLNGDCVED